MTKSDIIVRKFVGKLPAKILPFNMRHLMYWEQYVYYSLDQNGGDLDIKIKNNIL